jgi:hypothetical protein
MAMQGVEMLNEPNKYQMRRMLLINAGTNMRVPSGRITAIDPRGGAAVLGDNGVGKTTTLRILPLFFGHLPSQIVAAGHGQEAMVRFVLPTDASAIAFEYQRGSDDEADLRLAVIRRRADDPDVPFYRLYRCGFRKELFVSEGRFLSDEETQLKASELGIPGTSKLTTSDYRSVILRTSATSKDKDKLRRYSVEWSYGPKQLDNLDRLVAAMVKKHINFGDIVQVAVGLVQHDLGQGAERAKLTFKQGRGPIDSWLRNRAACLDAFSRAPGFAELEDDLREHRVAEAQYRSCRADTSALKGARERDDAAVRRTLDDMAAARATKIQAELLQKAELGQAAATASRVASATKLAYEDAAAVALSFETEKAAHWERQVQELPVIRGSLQTAQAQIELAEARQLEATTRYGRLDNNARTNAGEQSLALEKSKEVHRSRLADALAQTETAEADARKLCDDEVTARRQRIDDDKEPLIEQRGTWESLEKNPAASNEAQTELDTANQRLLKHTEETSQVLQLQQRMLGEKQNAAHEFAAQEGEVAKARAELTAVQVVLAETQARLNPPEGTLLAALRASPNDHWKRTLAKVVDPALLERDDLDPTIVDDEVATVFGWNLNTGAIAAPDWTDDALARLAIEAAQERLGLAQSRLHSQQDSLASKSRKLQDADLTAQTTQARASVLSGQTQELKNQAEAARLRVTNERRNAAARAHAELGKLNTALEGLKQQRRTLDNEHAASLAAVKIAHEAQRTDAKRVCLDALATIDASIFKVQADLATALQGIAQQLNEHLSKEGVDVNRLNGLKQESLRLLDDVSAREARTSLVDRWKKWLGEGGASRVEILKASAKRAVDVAGDATRKHAELLLEIQKSEDAHQSSLAEQDKRKRQVADDIETLKELDESFGDYMASGESVIDPETSARDLKSKARRIRAEIDRLEAVITKRTSTLRQALTAKNSTVKDLVEATLGQAEDGSAISRAAALCRCYKQIGPQVANDVNITLKTLLANIGAFQKAIQSFEREVAAFNRRLQSGLTEVKCFERVKDLRLDIVTNFDGLGFYKKLSRMEDVVRKHANEMGKDYTRELPPDETARALSEFMNVLGADGNVEVNLSSHITLKGSVTDNGTRKEFKRASELENISSEGLTSLVLITLMTALLNTIRGAEPVHVPWVTDEVGKFDPKNFRALMQRLSENRIDVVTASPELGLAQQAMFAQRYLFEDRGRIREYRPMDTSIAGEPATAASEASP